MRSRSFISLRNNGFYDKFNDLSSNDMINLRGGDGTPNPKPGQDYPIDPLKTSMILPTYTSTQPIPVLMAS